MARQGPKTTETEQTEPSPTVRGGRFTARQKLVDAAYIILSQTGLERSTIAEIVQEAGVGVGSFYNHFSSKEEIAQAVYAARTEELGARIGHLAVESNDSAIAACYAYRSIIELAHREPIWGAFITQIEPTLPLLDRLLRGHAQAGMKKGVASGRLKVDDINAALTMLHAMCISVVRAYLNKEISLKAAHATVKYPLRMFGVPIEEADDLASWPMNRLLTELKRK